MKRTLVKDISTVKNVFLKPLILRQLPLHIQLEPTTYCNFHCRTCSRSEYSKRDLHIGVEQFQHVISQIHPQKLTLSGFGEPFMHPQFTGMIAFAKQQGCAVNTATNGTFFNEAQCVKLIQSGIDLVKISIDAATPETYEKIREKDKFEYVLDGIRRLTVVKKRLHAKTPFLRFNYVITNDNYHEIAETIVLASTLGIDTIYFQPLELIGIETRSGQLVHDLQYEHLLSEVNRAIQLNRKYQISTNLSDIKQKLPLYWKKYQLETRRKDERICLLPWFSTYITVEGEVRPCCSFAQTEANMGNIFEEDIETIWNGKKYQQFRLAIRQGIRPYPICANCVPQTLTDILRASEVLPGFLK